MLHTSSNLVVSERDNGIIILYCIQGFSILKLTFQQSLLQKEAFELLANFMQSALFGVLEKFVSKGTDEDY